MFTIPAEIFKNNQLLPASKLIYALLHKEIQESPEGCCRISQATIGGVLNMTNPTVKAALEALVIEGLIARSRNDRGWLAYTLKA